MLAEFGDGSLGGILSVDISDWSTPGIVYGKPAMQCSSSEIEKETWEQMKVHLNVTGTEVLQDENVLQWFLDPDVQFPNPTAVTNLEPLMIKYLRLVTIPARGEHRDPEFVPSLTM